MNEEQRTCNLERGVPSLLISNADRLVGLGQENLAVSNLSAACGIHDRVYCSFHHVISQYHFQLDFWNQIHGVLSSAIKFSMSFLPSVTSGFEHGHSFNANVVKCGLHRLQLRSLDHSFNFCHRTPSQEQISLAAARTSSLS